MNVNTKPVYKYRLTIETDNPYMPLSVGDVLEDDTGNTARVSVHGKVARPVKITGYDEHGQKLIVWKNVSWDALNSVLVDKPMRLFGKDPAKKTIPSRQEQIAINTIINKSLGCRKKDPFLITFHSNPEGFTEVLTAIWNEVTEIFVATEGWINHLAYIVVHQGVNKRFDHLNENDWGVGDV